MIFRYSGRLDKVITGREAWKQLVNVSHVQREQGFGWYSLDYCVLGQFSHFSQFVRDYYRAFLNLFKLSLERPLGTREREELK